MPLIKSVRGYEPRFGNDCFLADNCTIVGDVTMGDRCTVWFNTVIRGDVHSITIGDDTNIQDGAIIHCTYQKAKTVIGNKVSIAHGAIVHGCTIEDNVLVGMGAIIMDDAVIGKGSVIAAGAIILPGTIVESNSIMAGVPGVKVKETSDKMHEVIERTAKNYPMYSKWYN
ncbi:MAG: gamma carbonic anhydrase family protein [Fulvivirga sp.]|uniref:gamma carbonic anhydrase family protein n=1 Tax=Fulvivirga sp. TaxID=1931237 RepID=UPI0032EEFDB7